MSVKISGFKKKKEPKVKRMKALLIIRIIGNNEGSVPSDNMHPSCPVPIDYCLAAETDILTSLYEVFHRIQTRQYNIIILHSLLKEKKNQ